jgi:hypothetical protein
MQVELGDDGRYPMVGLLSISFQMLVREFLDLNEVIYVLGMHKNIILGSCLTDLKHKVEFDDEKVIIRSKNPDLG